MKINTFKNQVINNGRKKWWQKEERKCKDDSLEDLLARAEYSPNLSFKLQDISKFFFTPSYQKKLACVETLKNRLIDLDQYSFRNFVKDVSKIKLREAGWLKKEELDEEMQIKYDSLKDEKLDFSQVVTIEWELEKHIGEKWAEKKINVLQKNTSEVLQSQDSLKVANTKKKVDKFLDECENNIYWLAHKSATENLLTDLNNFNSQGNDVKDIANLEISPYKLENKDNDNV